MARADIQAIRVIQDMECADNVVVVQEWLALSHGNSIADTHPQIFFANQQLPRYFTRKQIAFQALFTRSAEGTCHGAAYLR